MPMSFLDFGMKATTAKSKNATPMRTLQENY